jgi:Plasmid pRiA4b ORF-3-like protein
MTGDNIIAFPGSGEPLIPTDTAALLAQFDPRPFGPPMLRQPQLSRRRARPATYVVRIDLSNSKPPIWRRLALDNDLPLDVLHDVLQAAMGWTNSHLHKFEMGPGPRENGMAGFLTDWDEEDGEEEGILERQVRLDEVLKKPGDRLYYDYDFGDGWDHVIKLEQIKPLDESHPPAHLLTGRRACPPEDIGGPFSYQELVEWFAAPDSDALMDDEWLCQRVESLPDDFDPGEFDLVSHRVAVASAGQPG